MQIQNKSFLLVSFVVGVVGVFAYTLNNMQSTENKKAANQETAVLWKSLKTREDLEVATFAGGCFWCMEGPFEQEGGVEEVIAGFAGGTVNSPTYEQVLSGGTGHRESVQIFYDPNKINYERLLEIYWFQIDPTDNGGQFADRGEHYTTAIFYHNEKQRLSAERSIIDIGNSGLHEGPIVTEVLKYTTFFPAEDYHQNFYINSAERYKQYERLSGRKGFKESLKEKFNDSLK